METIDFPTYQSTRLVGLELEFDAGRTTFTPPILPAGWVGHSDGSLRNGQEYVLEPAVPLSLALPYIRAFDDAVTRAKTNVSKSGGYHVHVQAHDLTHDHLFRLVQIYTHFQRTINGLVGASRRNNTFCPPYDGSITKERLVEMFSLHRPAASRGAAKGSRQYSVINLAMCRCANVMERSAEFRQGSTSRKAINVFGWASFVTCLVDLAQTDLFHEYMSGDGRASLVGLAKLLHQFSPASGISQWVKWRHEYMNEDATPELIERVIRELRDPHGIFHISRQLNINLALAKKTAEAAVAAGRVQRVEESYYRAAYRTWAAADLSELEREGVTREAAAALQPHLAPTGVTREVATALQTVQEAPVQVVAPVPAPAVPVAPVALPVPSVADVPGVAPRLTRPRRPRRPRSARGIVADLVQHETVYHGPIDGLPPAHPEPAPPPQEMPGEGEEI